MKVKRLQRCQQLLAKFPTDRSVRSIWFADQKTFTVASPVNSQNDRQSEKGHSRWSTHSSTGTFQSQHHGFGWSIANGEDKCGLRRSWRKDQQRVLL